YCQQAACVSSGGVRRCSDPAHAGDLCDGDENKPDQTKACNPCGPGMDCIGFGGGPTGSDGHGHPLCPSGLSKDCPCGMGYSCMNGTESPRVPTNECFICSGGWHTGCSIEHPCCDGTECTGPGNTCCGKAGHECTVVNN